MRQDYALFTRQAAEIIVIGPDEAAAFENYWEREHLPFIGIPDPEHELADAFGQEVNALKLGRMPALLVIDKHGDIRFKHYSGMMWDIPANPQLLALLQELNQSAGG